MPWMSLEMEVDDAKREFHLSRTFSAVFVYLYWEVEAANERLLFPHSQGYSGCPRIGYHRQIQSPAAKLFAYMSTGEPGVDCFEMYLARAIELLG